MLTRDKKGRGIDNEDSVKIRRYLKKGARLCKELTTTPSRNHCQFLEHLFYFISFSFLTVLYF